MREDLDGFLEYLLGEENLDENYYQPPPSPPAEVRYQKPPQHQVPRITKPRSSNSILDRINSAVSPWEKSSLAFDDVVKAGLYGGGRAVNKMRRLMGHKKKKLVIPDEEARTPGVSREVAPETSMFKPSPSRFNFS